MNSKNFIETDVVYFDSATQNLIPLDIKNHYLSPDRDIDWARNVIKNFISAEKSKEIVFTNGNSHSVALIISGLKKNWRPNDTIIVPESEHGVNFEPWKKFAEDSECFFETINIIKDGRLDLGHLEEVLTNANGKILFSVSHVSATTGYLQPLDEVFSMIKQYDGITVLDATHSITNEVINVQEQLVDILFFHSANTYNYPGVGVLYAKQKILEKIEPIFLETDDLLPYPERLESSYLNYNGIISLSKSIEWLQNFGMNSIKSRYLLMNANLQMVLNEMPSIDIFHPNFYKAGIISFTVRNHHSLDIRDYLKTQNIIVSAGKFHSRFLIDKDIIRLSWDVNNTKDDVERLNLALKTLINR